eukprot:m.316314 g.316314  ORF g.316314 m.316314 type:complete len:303 (+) comp16502_c0_seq3:143-1051(+)
MAVVVGVGLLLLFISHSCESSFLGSKKVAVPSGHTTGDQTSFVYMSGAGTYYTKMYDKQEYETHDIRSGNPKSEGIILVKQDVIGTGDYIQYVEFDYRYAIGFCKGSMKDTACRHPANNPILEAEVILGYNTTNNVTKKIYSSGHLPGEDAYTVYSYDDCVSNQTFTCYAPSQHVKALVNLKQPKGMSLHVQFSVKNENQNLQIPIKTGEGFNITLSYGAKIESVDSVGEDVIIGFLCVVGVYFMIGAAFQFQKGERGADLVPNKMFWSSLPGLIADGFIFSVTFMKKKLPIISAQSSYDNL